MKVVLSTVGTFHVFDLARELHSRGALEAIFTGYPRFKLHDAGLPPHKIRTYPWVHTPYMAFNRRQMLGQRAVWAWERWDQRSLDAHVARHIPMCDVFVGLSGSGLRTGRRVHQRGGKYVCDRGSSHIRVQAEYLNEEHARWGISQRLLPASEVDPRTIEQEEAEYAEADCITVPSTFTLKSFLSQGIPQTKLRRLPYGVNLERFYPDGHPAQDRFDVLFAGAMCLRKGVPYLLQAYKRLRHPNKSITFAGDAPSELIKRMKRIGLWPDDAIVLGHITQPQLRQLMSKSHVLALPSIEEGLALVQAQAMACGCPVIATPHTGSDDLYEDKQEGFIVPVRDSDSLAERMQQLADQPEKREQMSTAALLRVKSIGGWGDYGQQAMSIYSELLS